MSKQYGLILPGQSKKAPDREVTHAFTKHSAFDDSSSETDENGPPQLQMKKAPMGPSLMERRKAKNLQEKALAEDPTIFQYDELYDEMENKREDEKQIKSKEPKKARYITKLMEAAERRKLENELRIERQVQKEREAEGEEFKDKEAFVTAAYRKKLEEIRELEEQSKREDYLEAIGDVTKQKDLDGFYRHIYEQQMGTSKGIKKPEMLQETANGCASGEDGVGYKPINSGKAQKQRMYRKRISPDDEEEREKDQSLTEVQNKKLHLTNNIDADSDFSIDETSTESETEAECKKQNNTQNQTTKNTKHYSDKADDSKISKIPSNTIALNLVSLKPEEQTESKYDNSKEGTSSLAIEGEKLPALKSKRDKAEIWRKRTVGDVYVAAVQRYYERKAARNQA